MIDTKKYAKITEYHDKFFRSHLERRWAKVFELLHIYWDYEPYAFPIGRNWKYTPDFLLGDGKDIVFAEIKPFAFSGFELEKCYRLIKSIGRPVLLLDGPPQRRRYKALVEELLPDTEFPWGEPYPLLDTGKINTIDIGFYRHNANKEDYPYRKIGQDTEFAWNWPDKREYSYHSSEYSSAVYQATWMKF